MNRTMTVTYEVEGALYVNVTNRCNNNCSFCIRKNGDGAYGSDSLWLSYEPSVQQIVAEIIERGPMNYRELVFCGYGEPGMRLYDCIAVVNELRERYPKLSVRINTNGTTDLIFGCDTAEKYAGVFDTVSISLNAPNAEKYDEICHPVYHLSAFPAIIRFATNVKKYVHNTVFTVVGDFLSREEIEECKRLCSELSIPLRIRSYISE